MRTWLTVTIAIALGLVTASGCGGPKTKPIERYYARQPFDASRYVDVDAVVLLDRQTLTMTFSAKQWLPYAELVQLRRIIVLKPQALHLRKVRIPFDETSGVLDVMARVTKPDGEVIDLGLVKTLDLDRFPTGHPARTLYNNPAAKVFAVPQLEIGDVLEYKYRRVIKDASWVEPLRVGGPYPVERGEIAVVYPDGFDVDYRVLRNGAPSDLRPQRLPDKVRADPEDDSTAGVPGTRLFWSLENLPALYPEPLRPGDAALATQVQVQFKSFFLGDRAFQGFGSWNDVARWYGRLIGDADAPESMAKKKLKALRVTRSTAKSERVRRINRFLVDEIVPIEFDGSLAALKVHGGSSVLSAGTGDAKDMATLAISMLRSAGVEGFPVLCSRRGSRAVAMDLPTPEAFNDVVIATVSGGSYAFFAPGGFGLPAGRLPWQVQGTQALLIRKSGAELVELPEDPAADNRREIDIRLRLARDGSAEGTAVLKLTGQFAGMARLVLKRLQDAQQQAFFSNMVFGEGPSVAVTGVTPPKRDDGEQALKLLVTLRATELARDNPDGSLGYSIGSLLGRPLGFLWREGRRTDVDLGFRFSERLSIAVQLPDDMGVGDQPPDRRRDTALVDVDDRFAVADGQAWFLRQRTHKVSRVEPAGYSELRAFYEALWQHQDLAIRAVRGGERGVDYKGEPF